MEMFIDILLDAAIDCVKMLPFLFLVISADRGTGALFQ